MTTVALWMVMACLPTQEQLKDTSDMDGGADGGTTDGGTTDGGTSDGGTTDGGTTDGGTTNYAGLDWVLVPAGSFTMGCTAGQSNCEKEESPITPVTLTRSFYVSTTEVTQEVYEEIIDDNPSNYAECPTCPVEKVSWYAAIDFANALSEIEGREQCYDVDGTDVLWSAGPACTGYRLPTEAEWEYAARAGEDTLYAGGTTLDDLAWYEGNSGGETHPVGEEKDPNAWGLYDMSGNVGEWVWDVYGLYDGNAVEDPTGATSGTNRVGRGGSWNNAAAGLRVSGRVDNPPSYVVSNQGFRVVRTAP